MVPHFCMCVPVQCHPLTLGLTMWLFYSVGHQQTWYPRGVISIFMSRTVFWMAPLLMLVPHPEAAPAAVWRGDQSPRALAEPHDRSLQEGSPEALSIAKTCGAQGHFTRSESLKEQWVRGGDLSSEAPKPVPSILFKRKKNANSGSSAAQMPKPTPGKEQTRQPSHVGELS